jgi:hypothetical protein
MARRIKGAQLSFFEDGHWFMIEDPNAAPAMARFLNG